MEERRLQHERETAERQAERLAALSAAEEERKQASGTLTALAVSHGA